MLIQNNQRKTVIKSSGKALNNYYVNVVENLVNNPANKYNRNKIAPVLRKLRRYF